MRARTWKIPAIAILAALLLSGCGGPVHEPVIQTEPPAAQAPVETAVPDMEAEQEDPAVEPDTQEENTMQITMGEYRFTVALENNETAAALKTHLPMTLDMSELNGNEKYNYLPFDLPMDTYAPGFIEAGDVMLYGSDCLVVFYKSFSTSYRYTKIGHMDDASLLQDAVGAGGVQMIFEG